ncbi:hypothetical protein [Burkholderia vietnamiensis]|uniref:hypothetical protein n=1 Tax=Burkholderia vietnamiensis TaxID=60552 RepID=UPI00158BC097|nr:hypothetical protein [Burkholderia vietnamiensis]
MGNNLAPYLNSHAAFIAQVANGSGLNLSQNISFNSHQINNLGQATANTDALTYGQAKSLIPIGTVFMWSGSVANVSSVWGPNYALCNGQNGTPDLRDRFILGAGGSYVPGATGGTTSYTLSVANMPVHNHGIYDPGHSHGVSDPGHAHGVYDPGHSHSYVTKQATLPQSGDSTQCWFGMANAQTSASTTGIGIYGSGTGIGIYGSGTGISINNAGSGQAFTVIPPFYALCFVMKIANN